MLLLIQRYIKKLYKTFSQRKFSLDLEKIVRKEISIDG